MLKNSKQLCCSCSISGIKKNLFASSLMIFKETEPNVSAHGAESQDQPYPEIQTLDDLKKARKTSEDADSNVDKSAADKNAITARAARNAINLFYDKVRETKKGSSLRRIWDKFRRWDRAQYWEKKRRIFKQGRKEAAQTASKNLLVEKDKKYTLTTDVNLFNRHGRPIGILSKSDPENKTETKIQPLNTKILTVDGEEYIKVKVYKTKR